MASSACSRSSSAAAAASAAARSGELWRAGGAQVRNAAQRAQQRALPRRTSWQPWSRCPGAPSRRWTAGAAARFRPPAFWPARLRTTCQRWWRASSASPSAPWPVRALRTQPSSPASAIRISGAQAAAAGSTALGRPAGRAAHLAVRRGACVHGAQHGARRGRRHSAGASSGFGAGASCSRSAKLLPTGHLFGLQTGARPTAVRPRCCSLSVAQAAMLSRAAQHACWQRQSSCRAESNACKAAPRALSATAAQAACGVSDTVAAAALQPRPRLKRRNCA